MLNLKAVQGLPQDRTQLWPLSVKWRHLELRETQLDSCLAGSPTAGSFGQVTQYPETEFLIWKMGTTVYSFQDCSKD